MALSVAVDPATEYQEIDGWGVDLAYQYAMSQDVLDLFFSLRDSITVGGTTGPGIGLSIAKSSSMYATWMLRANPTASEALGAWGDYLDDGAGNAIQGNPAVPNFANFAMASSKSVIEGGATIYATPGQGVYDEPLSNALYVQNTHGVRILGIIWPRIEYVQSGASWAMQSPLIATADTYAQWAVRCLVIGAKAGLNFWAVEPANEPEGGAGPNLVNGDSTYATYLAYLVAFRARLNEAIAAASAAGNSALATNLSSVLKVGPSCAQWGASNGSNASTSYAMMLATAAYESAHPYAGGPHVTLLDGMASHNYAGKPDGAGAPVSGKRILLPSEGSPISSATEANQWNQVIGVQSDRCTRGNAQDVAIGLANACMFHEYVVNRGATGYTYFWARSHGLMPTQPGIWGGAYGGLRGGVSVTFGGHPAYQITPDPNDPGDDRMRFWALGNFSRFVRPGWRRISTNHPGAAYTPPAPSDSYPVPAADVYVSAYKSADGTQRAVVAINTNATAQDVTITGGATGSSVVPWVTSATQNLEAQSPVAVSGGSFTYTLPANSVVTFAEPASPTTTTTAAPGTTTTTTTTAAPGPAVSIGGAGFDPTPGGAFVLILKDGRPVELAEGDAATATVLVQTSQGLRGLA